MLSAHVIKEKLDEAKVKDCDIAVLERCHRSAVTKVRNGNYPVNTDLTRRIQARIAQLIGWPVEDVF